MINKMIVLVAMVLAGSEIFAQSVEIRGVTLRGSGCGPASASASITPDGQILSVLFDDYKADIGEGSSNPSATMVQKDCHVLIDVNVPYGMQYALEQTDYRGFSALPASAFGFHRFTQFIEGAAIPTLREAQLKGPSIGNYEVTVRGKPGRSPYSTCNKASQTIDLFSQLMVSYLPGTRNRDMAYINLDSVDTGVHSTFKLVWRRCR
jgi:hypothetical protein